MAQTQKDAHLDTAQYDKLYWYCFRRIYKKDAVFEIFHDALLNALKKEPNLFYTKNGYKKLYKYCYYTLLNKNRQRILRNQILCYSRNLEYYKRTASSSVEQYNLEVKDWANILTRPLEKQIYKLTLEGYTCKEIGNLLKLGKDKVNNIQKKIREKLNESR